jgi:hypothetical protein
LQLNEQKENLKDWNISGLTYEQLRVIESQDSVLNMQIKKWPIHKGFCS